MKTMMTLSFALLSLSALAVDADTAHLQDSLFNLENEQAYFKYQQKMILEAKQNAVPGKFVPTVVKFVDMKNPSTQRDGGLAPGEFAITLDDGPDRAMTGKVLKVLEEYGVKVNYFLAGINARKNPELVKREMKGGHTIGHHSYSHPNIKVIHQGQGAKGVQAEIEKGVDAVMAASDGVAYPFFRFPFGAFNQPMLRILYDMDMVDFFWMGFSFGPEVYKPKAVKQLDGSVLLVKGHGIILKHDTGEHPGFDKNMKDFLDIMIKYGYKSVLFVPSYLKPLLLPTTPLSASEIQK